MTLIKCEECGEQISDKSKKCIHCGNPIEKKIICCECNKEVNSNTKVCPNCGNKLTKSTKDKIKNISNNNFIKKLSKKKLIIIGIISIITILCIIIISIITNNNKEKLYKKIYINLLDANDGVEILAGDLYSSWHYGIYEKYHSRYTLAGEITLTADELNNNYCKNLLDDWMNTVDCTITAHENLGHYKEIKEILDNVKLDLSKTSNSKNKTYNELNELYINLNNYYKLSKNYEGNYNTLNDDISNYRNLINNNISKLDLLLNFDSESFDPSNKNIDDL